MLKTNGFINYYGLQRFGSSLVSPTYVVGKSLARGNCEEVNYFLIHISNGLEIGFYKICILDFNV